MEDLFEFLFGASGRINRAKYWRSFDEHGDFAGEGGAGVPGSLPSTAGQSSEAPGPAFSSSS